MKLLKLLCLVFALTFITAGFKSEAKKVNESNKSLLQAAADGTIEQFKLLLSKGGDVNAENEGVDEFQTRFLMFCDLASAEFKKEITRFADRDNADPATHHMPFFEDAHAVRALAVACDMTGKQKYLDACRRWSDQIIEYQRRMIPAGAYYMNHSRAPGEDQGQWNVADSGSIAMGVLATAIRCDNPTEKAKYIESVKAFARLVMDNYVGPEGGISNGLWPVYDGQWWCSTATFGTMAFVLYEETGEKKYLKVAKGALDWMTHQAFREVKPITFQQRPSGIIFYCFELYATGLRYLKPGSQQYERAMRQIDLALDWMAKNQYTSGANVPDYVVHNVDMAGLPYLMYAFARQLPKHQGLTNPADCELRYIGDLLLRDGIPNVSRLMVWEVMTWGMMSYAERLSPGAMHRSSKQLRGVPAPKPPAVADKETSVIAFERTLAAADLVALKQRCGAAEPLEESLQLVRRHAFSGRRSGAGKILAFEENRLFIYALADMSGGRDSESAVGSQKSLRRIRRFFLLKPSIIVIEDLVSAPGAERPVRWLLRSAAEPKIEGGQIRVFEADTEILGESLLPMDASLKAISRSGRDNQPADFRVEVSPKQASDEARFLHVFGLGGTSEQETPTRSTMAKGDKQLELTVAARERVFRLTLPFESSSAGSIEVVSADGRTLLPNRLLPSGVMPHGPEGARLLERWDAPYRRERFPGWDVGKPCSHLVKAVKDETFRPGRTIVLGCGSGTNAIYLASKGFEVTGVDIAPSALVIAAEKARKAGVKVNWMVANIVALPKLEAFDLVFDRGCYHHICQYNSAGYVETLRRLSHGDTRVLILAGSDADGRHGGPPRVKEETIRNDFSKLFEFEWLRGIRFDTRNASADGASAWSIHLHRKDE